MNKTKLVSVSFDSFPDLDEHWKEQIGLGAGALYKLQDGTYVMTHGSNCACCNPSGKLTYTMSPTGKLLEKSSFDIYKDHEQIVEIIKL